MCLAPSNKAFVMSLFPTHILIRHFINIMSSFIRHCSCCRVTALDSCMYVCVCVACGGGGDGECMYMCVCVACGGGGDGECMYVCVCVACGGGGDGERITRHPHSGAAGWQVS